MTHELQNLNYDLVVVGSGSAGCAAARSAADAGIRVLLLSKDPLTASDTKIAEGIVTVRASGDATDTESALSLNMQIQGDDLADTELINAFARDSDQAYEWLVQQGLISSLSKHNGKPQVLPMALGGHDRKRSVEHPNGALDYAHALWNSVQRQGDITIIEDAWAIDLMRAEKRVSGLLAYHAAEGRYLAISCNAVLLACGGASSLYFPCTDTMRGNSGDAYGMALRAGLPLVDMEQVQFLPFGIASPRAYEGILAGEPVSCGPLGVLRDVNGDTILAELMVRTRAECASAIATAVADGRGTENGGCWLDLTANVAGDSGPLFLALMREKAGGILTNIKKAMGQKAARFEQWWEVRPTAHYFMGGVVANQDGATELPGLFVAGQAMGGLHGSNRLGSTSLAEGAIFGRRSGAAAAEYIVSNKLPTLDLETRFEDMLHQLFASASDTNHRSTLSIQKELQNAAYTGIGPARNMNDLSAFAQLVGKLEKELKTTSKAGPKIWNQSLLDYLDTRNMLASAKAITVSAQARPRSLGAHVRSDNNKARTKPYSIIVQQRESELVASTIARQSSPVLKRQMFKISEVGRLLRLKLLSRLSVARRDKILSKMYTQMLSSEHQEK